MPAKYDWNPEPLKTLIDASGMSCETVAENSGVSLSVLYLYLRGTTSPGVSTLSALADYFAVPMDYLLGRYTIEQAEAITSDYAAHFMELRRAPWEAYLTGRRGLPQQYIGYSYEAPWPYNLLDDLVGYKIYGTREREDDFWGEPIDDKQMAGLEQSLDSISPREKEAVLAYYKDGQNLEQVGNKFDVTRERARQIIAHGVRKLRHPSRFNLIRYGADYKDKLISSNEKLSEIERETQELQARKEELTKQVHNLTCTRESILAEICASAAGMMDGSVQPKDGRKATGVVTLDEMELSVRSWNCLKRAGVNTLPDLVDKMKSGELVKIRNLGKRSILELLDKVKTYTGEDYSGVYGY